MTFDRRRSELRLAALRRLDLPRDYNDSQFAELDAHNSNGSVSVCADAQTGRSRRREARTQPVMCK